MIAKTQKTANNIQLLAAQRQLYNEAKRIGFWKTLLVLFTSLGTLIAANFFELELPDWLSGLIGFTTGILLKYILDKAQAKKVELAAKIQEKFDIQVFGLSWHSAVVGTEPSEEDIILAADRFQGEKDRKHWQEEGWYSPPTGGDENYQALFCQRSNFVWEWRQRRFYSNLLLVVLILCITLGFVYCLWQDTSLRNYFLLWLIPSLPFVWLVFDAMLVHYKLYVAQQLEEESLSKRLSEYQDNKQTIGKDYLRLVQDKIFKNRSQVALIPNPVYNYLWPRYEQVMHASANSYKID